jgi:hypothetical protein
MGELRPNNLELDAIASSMNGNPVDWGDLEKKGSSSSCAGEPWNQLADSHPSIDTSYQMLEIVGWHPVCAGTRHAHWVNTCLVNGPRQITFDSFERAIEVLAPGERALRLQDVRP